jgi:predicted O-methyltransferase YrrM
MALQTTTLASENTRGRDKPFQVFLNEAVREYRDKVIERVLRKPLLKPWMKYREIRIMEEILAALKPRRALEWGAGYGTLHFSGRLPPGGEWIAIEHDAEWAERIRRCLPGNARVLAIPPERGSWDMAHGDGAYGDFRNYVDYPAGLGEFEFILVDGRARQACLRRARSMLSKGGVVVLHDANRSFLRGFWDLFPHQVMFSDYRAYSGGIWIGSVYRPIHSLIDLRKHRRIWGYYNSLGKRLRL